MPAINDKKVRSAYRFRSYKIFFGISYKDYLFLPVSIKMAGKNTVAIKKVVNKIPKAIVKPNRNNSCKGCVIKTPKVAAKIKPPDTITPPVKETASATASFHGSVFANSLMRDTRIIL